MRKYIHQALDLAHVSSRTLNNDIPGHNLSESLNLKGDRYNLVVAMFFVVRRFFHK